MPNRPAAPSNRPQSPIRQTDRRGRQRGATYELYTPRIGRDNAYPLSMDQDHGGGRTTIVFKPRPDGVPVHRLYTATDPVAAKLRMQLMDDTYVGESTVGSNNRFFPMKAQHEIGLVEQPILVQKGEEEIALNQFHRLNKNGTIGRLVKVKPAKIEATGAVVRDEDSALPRALARCKRQRPLDYTNGEEFVTPPRAVERIYTQHGPNYNADYPRLIGQKTKPKKRKSN